MPAPTAQPGFYGLTAGLGGEDFAKLRKDTLTLSGSNEYLGDTWINGGSLIGASGAVRPQDAASSTAAGRQKSEH